MNRSTKWLAVVSLDNCCRSAGRSTSRRRAWGLEASGAFGGSGGIVGRGGCVAAEGASVANPKI